MADNDPKNIVPWGLHPLMDWVEPELLRRSKESGMDITTTTYSGPKTSWVRFFSNGISPQDSITNPDYGVETKDEADEKEKQPKKILLSNHEGFVMGGVHGFNESYGFTADGRTILGYDANGEVHSLPSSMGGSFPHRPPPSIESVDVTLYGGQNSSFSGLCRKARVNWKCYSLDQLNYLAPYFLFPKITAVVEWGWNNYNPSSLVDLKSNQGILDLLLDGNKVMDKIELSNGNYDLMLGFIFNYGFSLNAQGGYDCFTEFVNTNWLIEGQAYKSTVITEKNPDGTSVSRKSFIEFVDKDINNLAIGINKERHQSKDAVIIKPKFNTDGKVFTTDKSTIPGTSGATENKIWLRMDLVTEIFNRYFSLVFKDIGGNPIGKGLVLDISETVICGHPAIKSINKDILIPNQYAPRFTTINSETAEALLVGGKSEKEGYKTLEKTEIKVGDESVKYFKLFKGTGIESIMTSQNLTKEFDDLKQLFNYSSGSNSFPVFSKGVGENNKHLLPGTWGYLKDIFVSTELIKTVMGRNDTAYSMIQDLLAIISEAFCGIVQLKLYPKPNSSELSIMDANCNPRSTPKSVIELTRFVPGSVNSAFMTNVGLEINLSQNMINQMVAQSSAEVLSPNKTNVSVDMKKANRFVGNDRLYDVGTVPDTGISDSDKKSEKPVSSRDFTTENRFYCYKRKGGKKKYILTEHDSDFMKSVLTKDNSGTMIYVNSPIMPGTTFTMETLGIGGFTFLGQFTLDHVPNPYNYKGCVWQIRDITQKIGGGTWKTEIKADCRPLSYVTT